MWWREEVDPNHPLYSKPVKRKNRENKRNWENKRIQRRRVRMKGQYQIYSRCDRGRVRGQKQVSCTNRHETQKTPERLRQNVAITPLPSPHCSLCNSHRDSKWALVTVCKGLCMLQWCTLGLHRSSASESVTESWSAFNINQLLNTPFWRQILRSQSAIILNTTRIFFYSYYITQWWKVSSLLWHNCPSKSTPL